MPNRVLLTTTSYQDTPGEHQELLAQQDWEVVRARGPLTEEQMLELAGEFDGFLCGDDAITQAVIEKSLPRLKCISKYGIGIDKIDKDFATSKQIPIGFCPGVNHTTVAEHVFGLLLNLTKKIHEVANHTRAGDWKRLTGSEIMGKTIGVIGVGRIGKEVLKRAKAFGLNCQGFDLFWDDAFAAQHEIHQCESVEQLLETSEIVSLNCLLDDSTENLIRAESLAKMQPGTILINCARGEIVNSVDIATALESGHLGGYGADVLEQEPPPAEHPLLSAPNAIITSHIGSRTFESVQRQAVMATRNLIRMLDDQAPLAQANETSAFKPTASTALSTSVAAKPAASKHANLEHTCETFYVVPEPQHNDLIEAAYRHRGYNADESQMATKFCAMASRHGIRTHNALKALHLDHLFGSPVGGCAPNATIEKLESRFAASEIWNANLKLGQAVAGLAIERCIELADQFGVGQVSIDNTFHYLWGGGYVMDAAKRGYIAYTNCTSTLAEVVPFKGKYPTLGTNPHSWAFPTTESIGYPIVIDWATSTVAMGRVQQLKREGKPLPEGCAVDEKGNPTTDPQKAVSLLPFGAHKGYGLALMNELYGGLIGGSLPTLRGRPESALAVNEKSSTNFYFQVIHPDALNAGLFSNSRNQSQNLKLVLEDILGHGNELSLLPGQIEAMAAERTESAGGLLFSKAEIESFNKLADECNRSPWDINQLPTYES